MKITNDSSLINIDLGKIASEISRHELQWVAVSKDNTVVASGDTYKETLSKVSNLKEVVMLKVPPLDTSISPHEF